MTPERKALIDQATQLFREQLEKQLPRENATLEQIEEAVTQIGEVILPDLQDKLVQQRTQKPRDNQIACSCGGKARYRGMATRTLITRHGVLAWRSGLLSRRVVGRCVVVCWVTCTRFRHVSNWRLHNPCTHPNAPP